MSKELFSRIIFLGDKSQFFDTKSKVPLTDDEAKNLLRTLGAGDEKTASTILELAQQKPVNSASFIKATAGVQSTYAEVYELIKPVLGLSKYSTNKSNFLYTVDEKEEVTFAGQCKLDRFEELIVLNDRAMDIIEAEYKARPELRTKSKNDLVRGLFDHFKLDRDLLLREEPPLLAYEAGPAFKVINPAEYEQGEHPAWNEFLARVDFPETFKAYVWSLFEPKNFGRQALWIYGEGNDGKSTIINTLIKFYGRDYTLSLGHRSVDETFFFGQAYGKRLAVYMDCKNLQILQKERIKSLLGRDNVAINDKHDKIFTGQVYSKLFICSNSYPQISFADSSERTRLLLVKVKSYADEDGDPDFQDRLLEEMPAFLNSCRESYETECPRGMSLSVPAQMRENIRLNCISGNSELIEQFIEEWLEFDKDASTPVKKLKQELKIYFTTNFQGSRSMQYEWEELKKLLAKEGCEIGRPGSGNSRARQMLGVRLKEGK